MDGINFNPTVKPNPMQFFLGIHPRNVVASKTVPQVCARMGSEAKNSRSDKNDPKQN